MFVHMTHLVITYATLSDEIFCCSFLTENLFVCVPSTIEKKIIWQLQTQKKGVGGKHNILVHYVDASAHDPSGVVLCNTFIFCCVCTHCHTFKLMSSKLIMSYVSYHLLDWAILITLVHSMGMLSSVPFE